VDRVRKTVKGGRIPSSRVVVGVGDRKGRVGIAMGKARQAPDAIRKAIERAKKTVIRIPLDGYTIPHEVTAKVGGAVVLLRPASRGTGIIAGGAVRQIVELAGIRDILSKSLGSGNALNRAKACFKALSMLMNPAQVAERRGKSVEDMCGRTIEDAYGQQVTAVQQVAVGPTEDEVEEAEGQAEEAIAKALAEKV